MCMAKYKELFLVFLKIGAFTFGGGYAMIPLIKREIVDGKKWLTDQEVLDIISIAESTPGPLAVNTATFVGSKVGGFKGAFLATIGVVLPSLLIMILISRVLAVIEHIEAVQYAFKGIRAGVLVLIAGAFLGLFRQVPGNRFSYCLMAAAFLAVMVLHFSTLWILIFCAAAGLLGSLWAERKAGK